MLSDVLCGSALAWRLGDGLGTRAMAVLVFAGCSASLAGWAPAAATAGCFGLEVAGLVFGASAASLATFARQNTIRTHNH